MKIVREKHPVRDSIRRQYGEGEDKWRVILKPSGSSKEEETGEVFVLYRRIGNLKDKEMYVALRKHLNDENTIAHIDTFGPFTLVPEAEKLKRQGIGAAVLDLLLAELKSEGVDGVSCSTLEPYIKAFLVDKRGFQEILPDFYFKKL